jgi:hypothetical protein
LERRDVIEPKLAKLRKSLTLAPDRFPFAKPLNRQIVKCRMEPYAKPNEKKVGAKRPKISHLPSAIEVRTRQERQAEKQAVAAERRAIKKSARWHLKQDLLEELDQTE